MNSLLRLLLLAFTLLLLFLQLAACSDYHERLLLRPLADNSLLASFNFRSNATQASFERNNFRLFPRALGQILQHTHAKELHLRFTVGRWDDDEWGPRPWSGAREGGTGVELWAWVEADSDQQANSRWFALTNALSGLFCASLNFIDSGRTIRPISIFEPEGTHRTSSNLHLLHGVLPHEVVCTENLTPFLKLLPCKGKAGISSLLDGHKLFDASFQSMAIDVRPICGDGELECLLVQIEQTVDMVLDLERSTRPRDNPIPRPLPIEQVDCNTSKPYNSDDSCYPLRKSSQPAWNLSDIFGRPIQGSCLLTADSPPHSATVCVNVPPERLVNVTGAVLRQETTSDDLGDTRCFEPKPNQEFSVELPEQNLTSSLSLPSQQLHAHRSITGYGQERGGIQTILYNPSTTETLEVLYLESQPWYLKPYLHTLKSSCHPPSNQSNIKDMYYRPALDRKRGTHLELKLVVPPASTLTFNYDFDKAFLRYTEYPPDANRGFDVAAAVIRILSPASPNLNLNLNPNLHLDPDVRQRGVYLRTTPLLLPLPTPDFSMPYNVIILTGTVMAFGFGSIFKLLSRRFVTAEEAPPGLIGLVKSHIGRAYEKLKQHVHRSVQEHEKTE